LASFLEAPFSPPAVSFFSFQWLRKLTLEDFVIPPPTFFLLSRTSFCQLCFFFRTFCILAPRPFSPFDFFFSPVKFFSPLFLHPRAIPSRHENRADGEALGFLLLFLVSFPEAPQTGRPHKPPPRQPFFPLGELRFFPYFFCNTWTRAGFPSAFPFQWRPLFPPHSCLFSP